jgi:hypothetical protein
MPMTVGVVCLILCLVFYRDSRFRSLRRSGALFGYAILLLGSVSQVVGFNLILSAPSPAAVGEQERVPA